MRARMAAVLVAGLLLVPATMSDAASVPIDDVTLLVMFERSAADEARAALHAATGGVVTGTLPELGIQRVSVPVGSVELYRTSPAVAAVQRPRMLHLHGSAPNDPLLKLQWPL